jgi:3-dehydroquinate synthetase
MDGPVSVLTPVKLPPGCARLSTRPSPTGSSVLGEAVSLGIVAAATISIKKAGLARSQRDAIIDLLSTFDLPTRLPSDFPREKIFDFLPFDKKFEHGQIRFVLTPKIGSASLSGDVSMKDIRDAVDEL